MSSGTVRRVSRQDIQLVQNLIERCLQLDMNRKEVVETLSNHAKIDPGFTELVWQKLEDENREFFNAYYLRLMVKNQIIEFNRLLEQQASMMHTVTSLPNSNGSCVPPIHQSCYAPEHTGSALKQESVDHPVGVSLANAYSNGGSLHSSMHTTVNMSAHARSDAPSQSSNVDLLHLQAMNGGMIKVETGYSNSSPYMFGSEGNVLDTHPSIGDASVASFASVDSNTPSFNESLLDPDSSFGFISQITRNFSLSDLTADFSHSSDILESYPGCPFLATEADNILDTCENGEHLDSKRLDSISENLSFEDFRNN